MGDPKLRGIPQLLRGLAIQLGWQLPKAAVVLVMIRTSAQQTILAERVFIIATPVREALLTPIAM